MSNTFTDLIPTMYAALRQVQRELVGFIPAVSKGGPVDTVKRAALNQSVRVPIAPAATEADNTPGVIPPDTGDQSIDNIEIKITKSKHVPVRMAGEEDLGLDNAGNYEDIMRQRFAQAIRRLVNLIEIDLGVVGKNASSRAVGTAGATPFGTAGDLSDIANVRQVLDDNGSPQTDLHLVLGSAETAKIRGVQANLFKVSEAGTDALLRDGVIGRLEGFDVHNSMQRAAHTKGTGSGYLVNDTTPPGVGGGTHADPIIVDTGTGTIVLGDVVTLAGDTNKYVVNSALASNQFEIGRPGLIIAADNDDAITVGNSYKANLAFHRSAIALATRLPAKPKKGDQATDTVILTDSISGLSFEVAYYPGFLQGVFHVRIAWGAAAVNPDYIATLMG